MSIGLDASMDAPLGCFGVHIDALTLKFKPPSAEDGGTDAAAENASIAVEVALVGAQGGDSDDTDTSAWWRGGEDARASAWEVTCDSGKGGACDVSQCSGVLSKRFPMKEGELCSLMHTSAKLTVYRVTSAQGEGEEPTREEVCSCTCPLFKAVTEGLPRHSMTVPLGEYTPAAPQSEEQNAPEEEGSPEEDTSEGPLEYNGSTSSVTVSIALNDDMCDMALGGCVLSVDSLCVTSPPPEWTLHGAVQEKVDAQVAEFEQKIAEAQGEESAAEGEEAEVQHYTVMYDELALEVLKDEANDAQLRAQSFKCSLVGSSGSSEWPLSDLVSGGGTVVYRVPGSGSAEKPEEGEGGEEAKSGVTVERKGQWCVEFGCPRPLFVTRQAKLALRRAIASTNGMCADAVVSRDKTKGSADGDEPADKKGKKKGSAGADDDAAKPPEMETQWCVRASLNMAGLMQADACDTAASATCQFVAPVEGGEDEGEATERAKSTAGASPTVGVTVRVSKALNRTAEATGATAQFSGVEMKDVVPDKDTADTARTAHSKRKPKRDHTGELKQELREVVQSIAREYMHLFPRHDTTQPNLAVNREEQQRELYHTLNTSGMYHELKERVKPYIQRAIRHRFESLPSTSEERNRFVGEVYRWLMEETVCVLNDTFATARQVTDVQVDSSELIPMSDSERIMKLNEFLAITLSLANDCEANGEITDAHKHLMSRAARAENVITTHSIDSHKSIVGDVWMDYAEFCTRASASLLGQRKPGMSGSRRAEVTQQVNEWRQRAVECVVKALAACPGSLRLLHAHACLALEQGKFEECFESLVRAVQVEDATLPVELSDDMGDAEEERWCELNDRTNMLLCIFFNRTRVYQRSRIHCSFAVKHRTAILTASSSEEEVNRMGVPRRTAVALALESAHTMAEYALVECAKECLGIAEKCEKAAKAKANLRGLFDGSPQWILSDWRRTEGRVCLLECDYSGAVSHLTAASELDQRDVIAWEVLGDAHLLKGDHPAAQNAYAAALSVWNERIEAHAVSRSSGAGDAGANDSERVIAPLRLYVRYGSVLVKRMKIETALDTFLQGCEHWGTCSMWLGAGIALLRLERFGDAEEAFQQANITDNTNPVVWAYLCLLCLTIGEERLPQANKCLDSARRFNLSDPAILREVANAYVAFDRLETAEELFRKSIAIDPSPGTRRRLADVLAAQNSLADAVNEYKKVIEDGAGGEDARIALGECEKLLKALGRDEELESLASLRESIAATQ